MEIIFSVIAIIISIIALSFQIKVYWKKHKIPKFSGRIGKDVNDGKESGEFADFIFKKKSKIIYLDIYFDNDANFSVDKEGIFQFSYFYDSNNKLLGGFEFRIAVNINDDFFYDARPISKRLTGYFKITGFSGPQQGWMTAIMKPVKIEST